MRTCAVALRALLVLAVAAVPALAGTISGKVSDTTGAALAGARVTVKDVATGREFAADSGADGSYVVAQIPAGTYLVRISRKGFAESVRTVVVTREDEIVSASAQLDLGGLSTQVSVTASRSDREIRRIPLNVQTIGAAAIADANALSTGDALAGAANVTQVGGGPFGLRPRLRGLDSTRLLVLVDGERLNTARQATERTGAEVGLVSPDAISRMEIVNGAGTLMYGSDALAGTINILTNEPSFSAERRWTYGLNTLYSANEEGGRGTLTLGYSAPRVAFRVQGGAEKFGNYRAGDFDAEDTTPLFTSGLLRRADTIDDAFGFTFGAFPDPFNAPFVRTDDEILNSGARGAFVNAAGLVRLDETRAVRVRYQQRRMKNVGFPDFAQPYFFNATSLPESNLDRVSGRYEAQAVTPWLANLSATAYYQRTDRTLRNLLPVQFPAPTPVVFFPISVMRLDILSETRQRVSTPGLDLQAVLTPMKGHLVTAGAMFYRDRSQDARTTTTQTSLVGQVGLGARGPAPVVFPAPVPLGAPVVAHPVRVPDASLRNVGLFAQDEWRVRDNVAIVAGLRGDFYTVTTEATSGYDVAPVVAGATPAIDPATLPDPDGATYSRRAMTGDIGLLVNPGGRFNPFIRLGRSYRHPNLEEMLFAGPATIGSIAPNVLVKPETGRNFDAGVKFRAGRVSGGVFGFVNSYENFIAQDLVVAATPAGPLAQATNYADVRISGVEFSAEAPFTTGPGIITLSGAGAFTRGSIRDGRDPLSGESIAGTPADNITPSKFVGAARFTDARGRWWAEYGVRAQGEVTRVAVGLLDSPFIIAQDLLSLDGFAVHRLSAGLSLSRGREGLTLVVALENVGNRFYREQFQFAPARGRALTIGLSVGAF